MGTEKRQSITARLARVFRRECGRLRSDRIYLLCMVVFPVLVTVFFTSLMSQGQPHDMPVGIVDLDNTTTTRKLARTLDAFQSTAVKARYPSFDAARQAMQRGEIYGFIYFPEGTTDRILSSRRPTISYYYSYASLTAGALVFRDLKTVATLGAAAVGSATMTARGYTPSQIQSFLQPITVDLHPVSNPWTNYNFYLSTMLVPGCILLFVFLITAYSVGMELKQRTSHELMETAGGNIYIALAGKLLPQTIVFLAVFYGFMGYVFGICGFPHTGGLLHIAVLGLLSVLAAEGFGLFLFSIFPSMRMSMSVCSLWGVLSFSMVGTAFPVPSMDTPLQVLSALFPLRHYFVIYQKCVLSANPLFYAWPDIAALAVFALLPVLTAVLIRRAMYKFVYIP